MRAAGREGDDERVLVDAAEPVDRLLARARDDLGADVEQRQQVAQVAGEEGHLVDADDDDAVALASARTTQASTCSRVSARTVVLDVGVVGGQRRLELGVVEVEERRRRCRRSGARLRYSSIAAC